MDAEGCVHLLGMLVKLEEGTRLESSVGHGACLALWTLLTQSERTLGPGTHWMVSAEGKLAELMVTWEVTHLLYELH